MSLMPHSSEDNRPAIETLIRLIEDAYGGDIKHSLLANLHDLRVEEWMAVPAGGGRSIADIVEHVAKYKWLYEDYAFGSASLQEDQPPIAPAGGARARLRDELLAWLADGHRRWVASVSALRDDAELERPRLAHFGQYLPTRSIIHITIAHDLYHAGEINHLRALLQGTDHWPG